MRPSCWKAILALLINVVACCAHERRLAATTATDRRPSKGTTRAACPLPEQIAPCTCTVSGTSDVDVDCSAVTSAESLAAIFFANPFPFNLMNEFRIVGNTALNALPDGFMQGVAFKMFNISLNTALADVRTDAFRGCEEYLEVLDISRNALTSLVLFDRMSDFKKLNYLDTGDNQIPGSIKIFPCPDTLKTLWMHRNKFTAIDPMAFSNCANLQLVGVGGNAFTSLAKDAFAGLQNVEIVALNVCPNLSVLQTDALRLTGDKVREIRVGGNTQLISVEKDAFRGETCNTAVLMRNCGLSTLPEDAFRPMLETFTLGGCGGYLDVTGCPLVCNCDLAWLLVDPGLKLHVRGQCQDGTEIMAQDSNAFCNGCPNANCFRKF